VSDNFLNLESLVFDNRFTRDLPGDSELSDRRRQVWGACYSRVQPVKAPRPRLAAYSREAAELVNLSPETCVSSGFLDVFSGSRVLPGMDPFAMCYGGHQFGNWAGQLGDGRAINLGDVINRKSERWTLQLKGAGLTPYSRLADGLAVLRSSIREFLCSEAMFHLGVPTTRALSVITTGQPVIRDMFYDGNPKEEPGAVVCRMAPSFTRFGNFEIFAARQENEVLQKLVDYTLKTDFPHLGQRSPAVMLEWYREVCQRTALMVAHWMRVGFVHGVMNTDNMSILGLTIDYGPYGWLENYDPDWTPNTTDAGGRRYRYSNQPLIAQWNLAMLANAICPLIGEVQPLQEILDDYAQGYREVWQGMMKEKLGLSTFKEGQDEELMNDLLTLLPLAEVDMTIFYRSLAEVDAVTPLNEVTDEALMSPLMGAYYKPETLSPDVRSRTSDWLRRYLKRLRIEDVPAAERRRGMNAVNPKYVLRNYLAQLAVEKAETGDFSEVQDLLEVLRRPYEDQPGKEKYAAKRPEWARHKAGCSMLSCSS